MHKNLRKLIIGLSICGSGAVALAAASKNELNIVLDGEVKILDPIVTVNYRTRDLAYMVYDMLFAMDSRGEIRPQMVDEYTISDDGLIYRFKLRDRLSFSDGERVTSADCIASIKRWGVNDGLGRKLMERTKELREVDDSIFELELAKPFGGVLEALGKPSSNVLAIMPKRLALEDPKKAVKEIVGSGPFIFREDLWQPGKVMVLEKNKNYVPRSEPADGFAGGKVVNIDRINLRVMNDASTKVAALQTGEIDYVQQVPFDYLDILNKNQDIVLSSGGGLGNYMAAVRPNHLTPPFNRVEMRHALQSLMNQGEILDSLGVPKELRKECFSVYSCDAKLTSDSGLKELKERASADGKSTLQKAGYKGEKIVVLHTSDVLTIDVLSTVVEEQLRRAGANVEVKAADWATISQLRHNKSTVEDGGWSLLPTQWYGFDLASPLTHYGIAYNCNLDGYAGWSCDEETKQLLEEFVSESDEGVRTEIAHRIQKRALESVSVAWGGQYTYSNAWNRKLTGVLSVGIPIFWNAKISQD